MDNTNPLQIKPDGSNSATDMGEDSKKEESGSGTEAKDDESLRNDENSVENK